MNMRQIGRDLENKVASWLREQGATFTSDRERTEKNVPSSDFIVLTPYPMAIDVWLASSPHQFRMKFKRYLACRIAMASRFGKYFPCVVVVPGAVPNTEVMYTDAVISAEHLPSLEQLKSLISINKDVLHILNTGSPGEVSSFLSQKDVANLWENSLSLSDLADETITFPEGSLATDLQRMLVACKKELLNESPSNVHRRYPNVAIQGEWLLSGKVSDTIECTINNYILRNCGGSIEPRRYRGTHSIGVLPHNVWVSPFGREVVLRRVSLGKAMLLHRQYELISEAWLTRAFTSKPLFAQILLAGELGVSPHQLVTLTGSQIIHKGHQAPPLRVVSSLEAAGWIVAPWDFSLREPHFIKLLTGIDHDQA